MDITRLEVAIRIFGISTASQTTEIAGYCRSQKPDQPNGVVVNQATCRVPFFYILPKTELNESVTARVYLGLDVVSVMFCVQAILMNRDHEMHQQNTFLFYSQFISLLRRRLPTRYVKRSKSRYMTV